MEQIKAPFTDEQVEKLKAWQTGFIEDPESSIYIESGGNRIYGQPVHPFTCVRKECDRSKRADDGILIPTNNGWVCPCGAYTQDWCGEGMVK